jgi:hypothetical protein
MRERIQEIVWTACSSRKEFVRKGQKRESVSESEDTEGGVKQREAEREQLPSHSYR